MIVMISIWMSIYVEPDVRERKRKARLGGRGEAFGEEGEGVRFLGKGTIEAPPDKGEWQAGDQHGSPI